MTCKDCIHYEVCGSLGMEVYRWGRKPTLQIFLDKFKAEHCTRFKPSFRFVELKSAEWIEDEDMYGDPIFRCSNCEARFVLEEGTPEDNEYYYCPTCGAKIQEQALKERAAK